MAFTSQLDVFSVSRKSWHSWLYSRSGPCQVGGGLFIRTFKNQVFSIVKLVDSSRSFGISLKTFSVPAWGSLPFGAEPMSQKCGLALRTAYWKRAWGPTSDADLWRNPHSRMVLQRATFQGQGLGLSPSIWGECSSIFDATTGFSIEQIFKAKAWGYPPSTTF